MKISFKEKYIQKIREDIWNKSKSLNLYDYNYIQKVFIDPMNVFIRNNRLYRALDFYIKALEQIKILKK